MGCLELTTPETLAHLDDDDFPLILRGILLPSIPLHDAVEMAFTHEYELFSVPMLAED
jgi:hypothetical protein